MPADFPLIGPYRTGFKGKTPPFSIGQKAVLEWSGRLLELPLGAAGKVIAVIGKANKSGSHFVEIGLGKC